jgi:diguanylate cyclase (GGDEF)-like protein/PAS domain S-box-containing protein
MKAVIESAAPHAALQDDLPADEAERLSSLQRLCLLDTPPAEGFDAVTRLAATILKVPILVVSLVDANRVWYKSRVGLGARESPRHGSFCSQAVFQRQPLIVRDASKDPRFADNMLVTGLQRIRSYLGIPLYTPGRQPIGALCAMDAQVRAFGEREVAVLVEFAKIIEEFLGAREFASKADGVLQYAIEREKPFRETFEQAAVGIVHTTLTGAVLRANQRACALLGYSATELRELSLPKIAHAEDFAQNVREFKRTLAGEIDSYALEQRLLRNDQRYLWISMSVSVKRTATRRPDYVIVVFEDISAKKHAQVDLLRARDALQETVVTQTRKLHDSNEALATHARQALEAAETLRETQIALQASNAKLATESVTDHLTGLPNRLSFSRRSEQAVNSLRLSHKPYGLILMDLDNFKHINDYYGHDVGDEVLRSSGKILLSQLRNSSDMAARLGGEEFAVLCFGDINEQTLHDVAERIRVQIGKEAVATPKGLLRFTASFGLALTQPDDAEWKSVYGRADAALHEAKAAGKDRVSFGRYSKIATAKLRAPAAASSPP